MGTDPDVLAVLALELQMANDRIRKLKEVLAAILRDAASDETNPRVWPIRAENFRRGTNVLAEPRP